MKKKSKKQEIFNEDVPLLFILAQARKMKDKSIKSLLHSVIRELNGDVSRAIGEAILNPKIKISAENRKTVKSFCKLADESRKQAKSFSKNFNASQSNYSMRADWGVGNCIMRSGCSCVNCGIPFG